MMPLFKRLMIYPQAVAHASKVVYERGFSFFSFQSALRPTPETLTTLNRTPGISPLAFPLRPKPASRTSSFSSTKFKQPSFGTVLISSDHQYRDRDQFIPKAVTFLPFLMSCTRTHFRMAEFGCLASTPTFSSTMPLAWEEPFNVCQSSILVSCVRLHLVVSHHLALVWGVHTPNGEDLYAVPNSLFL